MKIVDNCLAGADVSEFNIAGGEPMLYPGLVELAKYIRSKGVKVSLITNGSLMDESWIKNYAGLYETIGFSVDSINDETNRMIADALLKDGTYFTVNTAIRGEFYLRVTLMNPLTSTEELTGLLQKIREVANKHNDPA